MTKVNAVQHEHEEACPWHTGTAETDEYQPQSLQGAPEFLRELAVLARQRISTLLLNGKRLTVLIATSEDAIARAAGTTMERHPNQSAERAPTAEQPSGVDCGRQ